MAKFSRHIARIVVTVISLGLHVPARRMRDPPSLELQRSRSVLACNSISMASGSDTVNFRHTKSTHNSQRLKMFYLYVSLHNPLMIACLNLSISTDQRSSPWSHRTRRELRDLARSHIIDSLRPETGAVSTSSLISRVTTVRYEDLNGPLTSCRTASGQSHE